VASRPHLFEGVLDSVVLLLEEVNGVHGPAPEQAPFRPACVRPAHCNA
jgi:hypothetical protein